MEFNIDKIISGLCVVFAIAILVYSGIKSFSTKDGSTADKVLSVIDSSSYFTDEERKKISSTLEKGADKDVQNEIYNYVNEDDLEGLEEYLGTILAGDEFSSY